MHSTSKDQPMTGRVWTNDWSILCGHVEVRLWQTTSPRRHEGRKRGAAPSSDGPRASGAGVSRLVYTEVYGPTMEERHRRNRKGSGLGQVLATQVERVARASRPWCLCPTGAK